MNRRSFMKWSLVAIPSLCIPTSMIDWAKAGEDKSVIDVKDLDNTGDLVSCINGFSNPADALLYLFRSGGAPDDRIDLDSLAEWRLYCEDNNLVLPNKLYKPYSTTRWAVIMEVCKVGKADAMMRDGKWSVTYDFENKPVLETITIEDANKMYKRKMGIGL